MEYIDEEVSTIISLIAIIVISIIRVYYKIINDEKQRLRIIKNTKYLDGKIKLKFQIIA